MDMKLPSVPRAAQLSVASDSVLSRPARFHEADQCVAAQESSLVWTTIEHGEVLVVHMKHADCASSHSQ